MNAFFASRRILVLSPSTWKKYAEALGLWLNFMLILGRNWWEATPEDAEYFKEWRLTDEANPRPVATITFRSNLAALRQFYSWASRHHGVLDPVAACDDFDLAPRGVRERDVKWLDPAGYRRWRDLGLRGLDREGREDPAWRGRNEQRDAAFTDGLYGSGLRLTEWASVLLAELPEDVPSCAYTTCYLADACAKGGYGHKYWLPRIALTGVLSYIEGARAKAVRRAQQEGSYARILHRRQVLAQRGGRLVIDEPDGRQSEPAITALGPRARCGSKRSSTPLVIWAARPACTTWKSFRPRPAAPTGAYWKSNVPARAASW
ncbi:site-specific integrase [Nonomuraea sp. CA-141351]|uniref:site-specific integrase n=1 Tax=Nonomuraea sp. CA-141351 TaxID=3239996 RepID=UPI003D95089E